MKRRTFLLTGLGAGGALFFGWALLPPRQRRTGAHPLPTTDGQVALNGWVKISPDSTVTIVMGKNEMGQGIHTTLAMILAEELECDWASVRVEHSPVDKIYNNVSAIVEGLPFRPGENGAVLRATKWMTAKLYREVGTMMTGGSSSVRDLWMPMREAGAAARASLVAAAAAKWQVAPSACRVESGVVVHDTKRLSYGELVADAPRFSADEFTLKDPARFTLLGKDRPRLDSAAKSRGTATYGVDVRVPGMLYAAVAMSPTVGGSVTSYAESTVRAMPGVKQIVSLAPSRWGNPAAVAVVADSWWRAKKGADALAVQWNEGPNAATSTTEIFAALRTAAKGSEGFNFGKSGDAEAALLSAATKVEAMYEAPYLAHATMEPMNCTVRVQPTGVDVWVPTQVPGVAREAAAHGAGVPVDAVTVHQQLLGGGFGRRLDADFVVQAAAIAAAVPGRAVQLLWTREADMQHDMYRPAAVSRLRGGLDAQGRVTAFLAHSAGPSTVKGWGGRTKIFGLGLGPDRTDAEGTWDQPYDFGTLHASHHSIAVPIPVGSWRAVGHSHQGFFVEGFIDELAAAAKQDPVAFRATLLAKQPRALRVLQLAAEKSGWGTPLAPASDGHPRARGIAFHWSFGSAVAEVAEVSLAPDGRIRVHRVVAAVDCGFAVNPNGVRQQLESGIIYGLSAALYGEITVEKGRVQQTNFHEYRPLRMDESPVIETHIVPSGETPSGIGEPGLPPIAPAVANAIFALTGERLRTLPLRPTSTPSRA